MAEVKSIPGWTEIYIRHIAHGHTETVAAFLTGIGLDRVFFELDTNKDFSEKVKKTKLKVMENVRW